MDCPWYVPDSLCNKVETECKAACMDKVRPYAVGAVVTIGLLLGFLILRETK